MLGRAGKEGRYLAIMKPIYLTGFMGAGKSTIGTLLAQQLGCVFQDLDDIIVDQAGMSIKDIFQTKGEEYFRELEAHLLEKYADDHAVLALGGGTLMNRRSMDFLKSSGIIVYLRATNKTLVERLRNETSERPLLVEAEPLETTVEKMMSARSSSYEAAHLIVDVDGLSTEEIVEELFGKISNQPELA